LPPVEFCRGTSPIHAAKSRPDRKTVGSATVAAIAVAPMTPMPGMVSSRDDAELGQMRSQCIDHLGALAHHQIARAVLHQLPLLLG